MRTLTLVWIAAAVMLAGCASSRYVARSQAGDRAPAAESGAYFSDAEEGESVREVVRRGVECEPEPEECAEAYECNKAAIFLGGAFEDGEEGFSFGLSYERRLNHKLWGVVFGELVTGGLREASLGAGLTVHPTERLFLIVGAGAAWQDKGAAVSMVRFGGGYDFELGGGWFIAPAAYLDILDGEDLTILIGLEIGKAW